MLKKDDVCFKKGGIQSIINNPKHNVKHKKLWTDTKSKGKASILNGHMLCE